MQAVILAAGMGTRLKDLTSDATKCMVKVNGVTLIERMLRILDKKQLNQIVIVVGYQGQKLIQYVRSLLIQTPIAFISNPIYDKTNNIYSLYLAREELLKDDTLLLESDLIFEEAVLDRLLQHPYHSLALVAKFESWMDGTVVELDEQDRILSLLSKKEFRFEDADRYYKTVNLYKFSRSFATTRYVPFLEAYCQALGNNEYYERVLKVIIQLEQPEIKAVRLEQEIWYEIDDVQDLHIAQTLFSDRSARLNQMRRYGGGYWRYPKLLDFCNLSNSFFPPAKLLDEIKASTRELLGNFPSSAEVVQLLAAKNFGLQQQNVTIGSSIAELIRPLLEHNGSKGGMAGTVGFVPEEGLTGLPAERLLDFHQTNHNLHYAVQDVMRFYEHQPITALILAVPDRISGYRMAQQDLFALSTWAKQHSIPLILDETLVDYADEPFGSLLALDLLDAHPELVMVKNIAATFGMPGLCCSLLASGDPTLVARVNAANPEPNIGAFAELLLQIVEKYKAEYSKALQEFNQARKDLIAKLSLIPSLRVLPSQANCLLCELPPSRQAAKLAQDLLSDYNILVQNVGIDSHNYLRVAVKTPPENQALLDALQQTIG